MFSLHLDYYNVYLYKANNNKKKVYKIIFLLISPLCTTGVD